MNIIEIILHKLGENSTWRGIILVSTALGVNIDPELQNHILAAGLGLIGIINIVRKGK